MRGTVRKISIPRRLVADLMHASMRVPFVSLRRPLNVRALLEARALAAQPPGWAAIFVKAFSLVAKEQPILRTLYVKWPRPSFYELPRSVAMIAISRVGAGPGLRAAPEARGTRDPIAGRNRRPDTTRQAGPGRPGAGLSKAIAGDRSAATVSTPVLVGRPEFRPPARQLVRQFRGNLGRRIRRRRASCAEPGSLCPQLWRGGARPRRSVS